VAHLETAPLSPRRINRSPVIARRPRARSGQVRR
jgi:hypothetical protein